MGQLITRSGQIRIIVILFIGIAILPFTPGYKQQHNMHLAETHAATLSPVLRADERFRHVILEPFTGAGGSLMVSGLVANDSDREVLRKLVVASRSPVRVLFDVNTMEQLQQVKDASAEPAAQPSTAK